MGEVDATFFQAVEHRPKPSTVEEERVPIIDLSVLNSPDNVNSINNLVSQIGKACIEWGFFQVINHGVSTKNCWEMEKATREFFGQSMEEKIKVKRDDEQAPGYYETEYTMNVRDWKEVFDFTLNEPIVVPGDSSYDHNQTVTKEWFNKWPHYPPQFRKICEEYIKETEKLAYKLMELIALSLDLPAKRFHGFFKDQTSFIKLNHYPPCPVPHLALGVGRHKDIGGLTILAQDHVEGLQVKRKSDGEWIMIKPIPNAFIINVGDIIQVWINERYESVEHRVMVNSKKERFSIAFFLNPAYNTEVQPLEEMTSKQNPPRYRPYTWGKFFTTRKGSSLKKLDIEDIQISDFKITTSELAEQLEKTIMH